MVVGGGIRMAEGEMKRLTEAMVEIERDADKVGRGLRQPSTR